MSDVEPPGIDTARVTQWFAGALPDVEPPLRFTSTEVLLLVRPAMVWIRSFTALTRWPLKRVITSPDFTPP